MEFRLSVRRVQSFFKGFRGGMQGGAFCKRLPPAASLIHDFVICAGDAGGGAAGEQGGVFLMRQQPLVFTPQERDVTRRFQRRVGARGQTHHTAKAGAFHLAGAEMQRGAVHLYRLAFVHQERACIGADEK